jgi:hypothetical protein
MYADLLEKLKAATGPDRELDAMIAVSSCASNDPGTFSTGPYSFLRMPSYTASIEACVSLIETELPGWMWKCGTCHVSDDAWVCPNFVDPVHGERLREELDYANMKAGDDWDVGFDVDRRPPGNVPLALLEAFFMAKAALHSQGEAK